MAYFIMCIIGYLLGCSNMATHLAKARGMDITSGGSGNPGASNATILVGWRAGILVAVHDAGKALVAVIILSKENVLFSSAILPTLPLCALKDTS